MICEICNGSRETMKAVIHEQTKLKTLIRIPCICFASTLVSMENNLIRYLGDVYMHPDKMDSQLVFRSENLMSSPNLVITGEYDNFALQVKALLLKTRFYTPKPRILFARSIDIVQRFHVPQEDEMALHMSSTLLFDLVIVVFDTIEENKALAPCMAQMVLTRKEEGKPTWIYFKPPRVDLNQCKEISVDLDSMVQDFDLIKLSQEGDEITKNIVKQSKIVAKNFSVGKS
jgi:hypothetical protein